uniref:Uncharacterized protein n=1 Tax=Triticum urartu TaxID=4572 RepID=A0A8R7QLM1_TRIUA
PQAKPSLSAAAGRFWRSPAPGAQHERLPGLVSIRWVFQRHPRPSHVARVFPGVVRRLRSRMPWAGWPLPPLPRRHEVARPGRWPRAQPPPCGRIVWIWLTL